MPDYTLRQMTYVKAVAESGSISGAADRRCQRCGSGSTSIRCGHGMVSGVLVVLVRGRLAEWIRRDVEVAVVTATANLRHSPTAVSRRSSSESRWSSMGCRSGTVRRQPVRPKTIWSSLLVQVMLSACPVVGIESG